LIPAGHGWDVKCVKWRKREYKGAKDDATGEDPLFLHALKVPDLDDAVVCVIKYFQGNMNNLQIFQGHNESIRDASWAPNDERRIDSLWP
jgi:hypothetical protein